MTRKDPVTPEIRARVMTRDIRAWLDRYPLFRNVRGGARSIHGCVAVFLAPNTSGPCSGKLTLDHIKDEPMMGQRAPSDLDHLVTLCEGHTERGAKAGFQWNTANRQILRWYLRMVHVSDG